MNANIIDYVLSIPPRERRNGFIVTNKNFDVHRGLLEVRRGKALARIYFLVRGADSSDHNEVAFSLDEELRTTFLEATVARSRDTPHKLEVYPCSPDLKLPFGWNEKRQELFNILYTIVVSYIRDVITGIEEQNPDDPFNIATFGRLEISDIERYATKKTYDIVGLVNDALE